MTPRQYYQGILEECQGGWLIFAWASQDQRTNRQAREEREEKTRILANACPLFPALVFACPVFFRVKG
jgi:hypothetical protein